MSESVIRLSDGDRWGLSVAASVLAHLAAALVLGALALAGAFKPRPGPAPRTSVSLVQMSHKAFPAGLHTTKPSLSPSAAKTAEEKKKEEEELVLVKLKGQVVAIAPPADERAPTEPTQYLSEYDSRVLKQTRAKNASALYKNVTSRVQKEGKEIRARPSAQAAQAAAARAASAPRGEGGATPRTEIPDRQRRDPLHLKQADEGTLAQREASDAMRGNGRTLAMNEHKAGTPGQREPLQPPGREGADGATGRGTNKALNLKLGTADLAGPVSGGPSPDDLRGVEEGDETLLNTRSFKFASFFNRLKEAVGRVWEQDVVEVSRRRDPSGQIFFQQDRRTVVRFTLDKRGVVTQVKVISSSGLPFLDDVAIDSFRKVAAFPNPPAALLGPSGTLTEDFAFTLIAGGGNPFIQWRPANPGGY